MNKKETTKEKTIKAVEMKVREYQGNNFYNWNYYCKKLERMDPYNPLLDKGFHGLPYGWR